jgi:F-type H+-transporting ATPase subunit delta
VTRRLSRLADERRGVVRASVTAASQLPEAFYERLSRELEALTGKHIALERHQDASLIAGVVTRIGDNTIDGSLRGRLESLGRQLLS